MEACDQDLFGNTLWIETGDGTGKARMFYNQTNRTPAFFSTTVFEGGNGFQVQFINPTNTTSAYGANTCWLVFDYLNGDAMTVNLDGSAATRITDAVFTAIPIKTNLLAMDGYVFVGAQEFSTILHSNINDVHTWAASSAITAYDTPGTLLGLAKVGKYLMAMKTGSLEFFENQGNPTPGSVLGSVKELNKQVVVLYPRSWMEVSDGWIWAGVAPGKSPRMYKMMKDTLAISVISDDMVNMALETTFAGANQPVPASAGLDPLPAFPLSYRGKEFYCIFLNDEVGDNAIVRCFAYDNELGVWHPWSFSSDGGNSVIVGCPIWRADLNEATSDGVVSRKMYLCQLYGGGGSSGRMWNELTFASAQDYLFPGADTSTATNIYFRWTSELYDFGELNKKFQTALEVDYEIGEVLGGSFDTTPELRMHYRDADKGTATTPRTRNLGNTGLLRAKFTNMGSFIKRRYVLTFLDNSPFKMTALRATITSMGTEQQGE